MIAVKGDPSRTNERRGIWLNKAVEVTQIFAGAKPEEEEVEEEGEAIGEISDWDETEDKEPELNNPKDCDELFGNRKDPKIYMRI